MVTHSQQVLFTCHTGVTAFKQDSIRPNVFVSFSHAKVQDLQLAFVVLVTLFHLSDKFLHGWSPCFSSFFLGFVAEEQQFIIIKTTGCLSLSTTTLRCMPVEAESLR